jgi:hypothetical protein
LKVSALRWLWGEFSTKTEARQALDVRTIIDDDSVYDSLKSLACLTKVAGYAGLLVMFDEMVNFYKLQSSQSRNQNFEQILRIVNDSLQGNTVNIGFVMCGTPEFLMDTRRGCTATKRFSRDWPSRRFGRSLRSHHQAPEPHSRGACACAVGSTQWRRGRRDSLDGENGNLI